MPHTAKGEEILESMKKTYGSTAKAEQVLHASANAGTITGIDDAMKMTEMPDPINQGKEIAPHNAFAVEDYK